MRWYSFSLGYLICMMFHFYVEFTKKTQLYGFIFICYNLCVFRGQCKKGGVMKETLKGRQARYKYYHFQPKV